MGSVEGAVGAGVGSTAGAGAGGADVFFSRFIFILRRRSANLSVAEDMTVVN